MLSETVPEVAPKTSQGDNYVQEENVVQEITETPVVGETVVETTSENVAEEQTVTITSVKKQIFIGNIPFSSTDEEVKQYFAQFGEISELLLAKKKMTEGAGHRGVAFISYSDIEKAEKVLVKKHVLEGRKLTVNRAKPKKVKFFVGGIDREKTDKESLRNFFSQYGEVTDCFCPGQKKFGFVTMIDDGSNINKILEQASFVIDGKECEVKTAQPKSDDKWVAGGRGRGGGTRGMGVMSFPYGGHAGYGRGGAAWARQTYDPYMHRARTAMYGGGYGYGAPRHYF